MTAKPAGEPRPRWTVAERKRKNCVFRYGVYVACCDCLATAEAIVAALNAAAPAPASAEAPGAPDIERVQAEAEFLGAGVSVLSGALRRIKAIVERTLVDETGTTPSAEALIAAGDALQHKLDVACEAVKAGMAERAALQAAGDALESAADDLESVPCMNMRLWTNYLEAKYAWRAAVSDMEKFERGFRPVGGKP